MGKSKVCVDYVWGYSSCPSSVDVYRSSVVGTEFDASIDCFDNFVQKLNQLTVGEVFGDKIRYLHLSACNFLATVFKLWEEAD
jgi:hypothetical protein